MYYVLTKDNLPAPQRPFTERFAAERKGSIWETIRNQIFFLIDCSAFQSLYSDHMGRKTLPINVLLLLAAIAEEMHIPLTAFCKDLSGNGNILYAIHADRLSGLPSESTLKRFGRFIARYNEKNQTDLLASTVAALSCQLSVIMGVNTNRARIDTAMVNIYATKLSRYQLIYVCVAQIVRELVNSGVELPDCLKHFTDDGDFNFATYHNRTDSEETKMERLLEDAAVAMSLCKGSILKTSEYQNLDRCLKEQTYTGDDGKLYLRKKGDEALNSGILQTPVDPDATFHIKKGVVYRGYTLCVIDMSNGRHHIVIGYLLLPNNVSDGKVASDLIAMLPSQIQKVSLTLVGDGGFIGELLTKVAQERGWTIVNTDLPGRKTPDCHADTQFNEDGTELRFCPNGKAPDHFKFHEKTGSVTGWFPKDACAGCPYKEQCRPREQKAFYVRDFSLKQKNRALSQRDRSTEEFKEFSHFRNGVESIFSVLRRRYRIDEINSHGLYRVAYHIGLMILMMNIHAFHADLKDKKQSTA